MSVQAITWAYEQDLPLGPKAALVALANHADGEGVCYPGQVRLSQQIGASERALRNYLEDLEARGLISRARRTREDGTRSSDEYRLIGYQPAKSAGSKSETTGKKRQVNRQKTSSQPAESAGTYKEEPSGNRKRTERRARETFNPSKIPLPEFVSPDNWQAWIKHLKALGKRITEPSARAMLEFLGKDPLQADELLKTAVTRNWAALYPLDRPRNGSPEPPPRPKPKTADGDWRELLRIHNTGRWDARTLSEAGKTALKAIGGWTAIYADDPTELETARQEFLQHHAHATSTQEETAT